ENAAPNRRAETEIVPDAEEEEHCEDADEGRVDVMIAGATEVDEVARRDEKEAGEDRDFESPQPARDEEENHYREETENGAGAAQAVEVHACDLQADGGREGVEHRQLEPTGGEDVEVLVEQFDGVVADLGVVTVDLGRHSGEVGEE